MLHTNRLRLVAVERAHKAALCHSRADLARLLGLQLPDGWPAFPQAFQLPAQGETDSGRAWPGFFFLDAAGHSLVGNGGFKGCPDADGHVHIGYEIAPALRNKGYATEAAGALLAYAFVHETVSAVAADTLAERNASNAVLRKLGMRFAGEHSHGQTGKVWRWRITRTQWQLLGLRR
jgi:RimJ/RimL family protein N-acetyltransferase